MGPRKWVDYPLCSDFTRSCPSACVCFHVSSCKSKSFEINDKTKTQQFWLRSIHFSFTVVWSTTDHSFHNASQHIAICSRRFCILFVYSFRNVSFKKKHFEITHKKILGQYLNNVNLNCCVIRELAFCLMCFWQCNLLYWIKKCLNKRNNYIIFLQEKFCNIEEYQRTSPARWLTRVSILTSSLLQ